MEIWLIIGGLIGLSAAMKRGYSTVAGLLVGALLGPLAVLMYLVDQGRKKCPHCAEFIKKQARICPFCREKLN